MKKINILLILLLPIIFISTVHAEDIYKLDFTTEENGTIPYINIQYKDGYLTDDYDYYEEIEYLTIYNAQGKIVKQVEVDYEQFGYIVDAVALDDNIYVIGYKYINSKYVYSLFLLNSNLEIQKRVTVEDYYYSYYYFDYFSLRIKDNKIQVAIEDEEGDMAVNLYEKDLSSYKTIEFNSFEEGMDYYPAAAMIEYIYSNITTSYYVEAVDYKDGKYVANMNQKCTLSSEVYKSNQGLCNSKYYIKLFNESDKEEWSIDVTDYGYIEELKFIDDYIIAVAYDNYYDTGYILIIDMKGNIVQTIKSENEFSSLQDTTRGFIVNEAPSCSMHQERDLSIESTSPVDKMTGYSCGTGVHRAYYLYHVITSVVKNGNGKIAVSDKGIAGESVTVTITPDDGYVLGEVKVTDANGNVLIFTSNTFTMPSTDVTIEVTFVKKAIINPETSDIAIVSVIILFIASLVIVYHDKKKLKI